MVRPDRAEVGYYPEALTLVMPGRTRATRGSIHCWDRWREHSNGEARARPRRHQPGCLRSNVIGQRHHGWASRHGGTNGEWVQLAWDQSADDRGCVD